MGAVSAKTRRSERKAGGEGFAPSPPRPDFGRAGRRSWELAVGKAGRGLLMIATDVDPALEAEINDWYDREHMEERVAIAGFVCARRYRALSAERKYLALYETETIAVFDGPEYRHKLANQTERSKRALKHFRRTHRAVGRLAASRGMGVGAALAMARLPGAAGAAGESLRDRIARSLLPKIMALPGLIAAHLVESDARLSQPLVETGPASTPLAAPDDWFLLVEASDPTALRPWDQASLGAELDGIGAKRLGVYALTYELSRLDLG